MTRPLRTRIFTSYVAFAVMVAVVFGFAAAAFLYEAEDRFFAQQLAEEAELVEAEWRLSPARAVPRYRWMSVHAEAATLPSDLRTSLLAEPQRAEFRGTEGRHYHVRPLRLGESTPGAWLVAEVHAQLVLRPARGDLLARWLAIEAVILAAAVGLAGLVASVVAREQAFTRDVSHELRTPLAVVRSTVSRLASDGRLSTADRPALARVLAACDRLEWTIRSLLALARERTVARGSASTTVRPVLEAVVLELEEPLRARALCLESDVPAEYTLAAERDVVHLVLGNVLGNVCAHSAPGVVRVSCDGAVLIVANPLDATPLPDGLGTRGARREDSPGFGLGLELSRRLCERSALTLSWRTCGDRFEVRLA